MRHIYDQMVASIKFFEKASSSEGDLQPEKAEILVDPSREKYALLSIRHWRNGETKNYTVKEARPEYSRISGEEATIIISLQEAEIVTKDFLIIIKFRTTDENRSGTQICDLKNDTHCGISLTDLDEEIDINDAGRLILHFQEGNIIEGEIIDAIKFTGNELEVVNISGKFRVKMDE